MKINLFLAICCLSFLTSCNSQAQSNNLSVAEFEKGIAQNNIQILDVRTPGEYQSGHLKNALLADWNNDAEFQQRVNALDKSKPVYTYCLSGGRSSAPAVVAAGPFSRRRGCVRARARCFGAFGFCGGGVRGFAMRHGAGTMSAGARTP